MAVQYIRVQAAAIVADAQREVTRTVTQFQRDAGGIGVPVGIGERFAPELEQLVGHQGTQAHGPAFDGDLQRGRGRRHGGVARPLQGGGQVFVQGLAVAQAIDAIAAFGKGVFGQIHRLFQL